MPEQSLTPSPRQPRRLYQTICVLALGSCLATIGLQAQDSTQAQDQNSTQNTQTKRIPTDVSVTDKIVALHASQDAKTGVRSFAIQPSSSIPTNHGGYIIAGQVHVYIIWYGNWNGNTALQIIPNFIKGLNGSSWENIMTTYYGINGNATNQVTLGGQYFDSYSHGSHLDDTATKDVVNKTLDIIFPRDNSGVYFVLTSPDVRQTMGSQEFCKQYCGYHSDSFLSNSVDIKYSFVGDPNRCVAYGYAGSCYGGLLRTATAMLTQ